MEDELGVFPILKLKTNISIVKTEKKNKQTNKTKTMAESFTSSFMLFSIIYRQK